MSDLRYFSKQFLTEFIELYKSLPALWMIKSKDYSNRIMKNQAYDRMIDKLKEVEPNADREMVTKKINSLRTSYRKERRKIASSEKSGVDPEDVYVSSLWYFDMLQFVTDQDTIQSSMSNVNYELHDRNRESPEIMIKCEELDIPLEESEEDISPAKTIPSHSNKKQKIDDQTVDKTFEFVSASTNQLNDDSYHFGNLVASKLRMYDETERTIIQCDILNVFVQHYSHNT